MRQCASVIKVDVVYVNVHISRHLKEDLELAWAINKWLLVISIKMSVILQESKEYSRFKLKKILYMLLCGL